MSFWIAKKTIRNHDQTGDLTVRAAYGTLEAWVSIIGNTLLFAVKIVIGISISSVSLIADAIHTLSDSGTSIVIMIGFKLAKKPSDKEHPFGHGRMESIAALIVAVLLFAAGVELLEKAVRATIHPYVSTASVGVILLITGMIAVKELMARFSYDLGDMIDSAALKADALHHRTDVFATALVVVALVASRFGIGRVDGIMGILVSFIIFYSAYAIAKDAINPLLGEAPSKEKLKEIEALAKTVPGVLGIHDIICHQYGQTSIISLHLEVSDRESASALHAISEQVEESVAKKMGGMVIAHIDPINKEHPQYNAIDEALKAIIAEDKRVASFYELRIIGSRAHKCNVVFDVALEENVEEREMRGIVRSIREKFKAKFPEMKAIIKAEPKYAYNVQPS